MKHTRYYILIVFLLGNIGVFAQFNALQMADDYFANFNYPEAVSSYKEAYTVKKAKREHIVQRLAESYRLMGDFESAREWYEELVKFEKIDPRNYFYYGKMLESNREFAEAQRWFQIYAEKLPTDSRAKTHSEYTVEEMAALLEDRGEYEIFTVTINSENDDFSPSFYGQKVAFVSNRNRNLLINKDDVWNNLPYLDIYLSDRLEDGTLIDANPFEVFNSIYHEGPMTFTEDLNRIYFTRNASVKNGRKTIKDNNNTTHLMIYTSRKLVFEDGNEQWAPPEVLDFNSKEYSCQHPALSPDGEYLYFASNMPGGYGGMDIYASKKNLLGWDKPRNLGPAINTSGDEAFPFIAANGDLFFSSNGLLGLGGLDIFRAQGEKGKYGKPVNVGYPLNDVMDDFGLAMDENMRYGYFSTNRTGGSGRDDILGFKVLKMDSIEPEEVIPEPTELKIFVYDQVTGEGLSEAVVNVFTSRGQLVNAVQMDENGVLFQDKELYNGQQLRFIASYPEYSTVRKIIDVATLPEENAEIRLPLNKDLGKVLQINPIYFDYDKANIRPDAAIELNKIIRIMKENPTMVIEVASHTDSRGRNPYNSELSQRRAKSSREYIIDRGIAPNRIFGQGYGELQLTNECEDGVDCSEYKHQLNRRTEFRIIRF